jgi:hypothetical protein
VKALLLRGASRDAKDMNGKTPMEIMPETLRKSLRDDLES